MRTRHARTVACSLALLVNGPSPAFADSDWDHAVVSPLIAAVAVLHPAADRSVVGKVKIRSAGDSLVIRLNLGGLEPERSYRLRFHQYGDCSANKAMSAGDPIGDPSTLIEFIADESGWVDIAFSHRDAALGVGLSSLLGHAVVVHGESEPVGCGTIGIASPGEAPPPNSEDPG